MRYKGIVLSLYILYIYSELEIYTSTMYPVLNAVEMGVFSTLIKGIILHNFKDLGTEFQIERWALKYKPFFG